MSENWIDAVEEIHVTSFDKNGIMTHDGYMPYRTWEAFKDLFFLPLGRGKLEEKNRTFVTFKQLVIKEGEPLFRCRAVVYDIDGRKEGAVTYVFELNRNFYLQPAKAA